MTKRSTNPDFLNGVPELVVLELLSRRPMYGYELVQAIKEESQRRAGIRRRVHLPAIAQARSARRSDVAAD